MHKKFEMLGKFTKCVSPVFLICKIDRYEPPKNPYSVFVKKKVRKLVNTVLFEDCSIGCLT